jgi:hypothetical protein
LGELSFEKDLGERRTLTKIEKEMMSLAQAGLCNIFWMEM